MLPTLLGRSASGDGVHASGSSDSASRPTSVLTSSLPPRLGQRDARPWHYYDLDPTYRNAFGQPLLRMTFDFKDNERRLAFHMSQMMRQLASAMSPTSFGVAPPRTSWSVVPYQSTHNTGGTIMGVGPATSAVNKYGQSWDCENLFVLGASVFPHNSAYNPTGLIGALSYCTAAAIRDRYVRRPGMLA